MPPTISASSVQRRPLPSGRGSATTLRSAQACSSSRGRFRSSSAKTSVTQPNTVTAMVNGNVTRWPTARPAGDPVASQAMAMATLTASAPPSAIFSVIQ